MKKLFLSITLSFLLILVFAPQIALANGAPATRAYSGSGGLSLDSKSGISLVEEIVHYDLDGHRGNVDVTYRLKNLDPSAKAIELMFLLPKDTSDEKSVKVTKDNIEALNFTFQGSGNLPSNWEPMNINRVHEPVSGKPIFNLNESNGSFGKASAISSITIPLTFRGEEIIDLKISYTSFASYVREKTVSTILSQLYYLTPAKFWEGDTKVTLKITTPVNSRIKLFSNLPLQEINENTYEGHFSKIPENEWLFSYTDTRYLFFGTNNITIHIICIYIIASIFTAIISILASKYAKLKACIFDIPIYCLSIYLIWITLKDNIYVPFIVEHLFLYFIILALIMFITHLITQKILQLVKRREITNKLS